MTNSAVARKAIEASTNPTSGSSGSSLWDITPFHISFEGLEAQVKPGRRRDPIKILSGASGEIKSGKITAVMGPSGAGKSSLFSVLMDKVTRSAGWLTVNGEHGSLKPFRKVIGFVPQDDIMHRELTVEEVLRHSALTRLPSDWPRAKKEELISLVLKVLGLEHVRHSIIGDEMHRGISGGERKRVNIGIELTSSPSILFLDEPTTGLDSSASIEVMEYIKRIANLGVCVAAILHTPRPEILNLCDDLLLLGRGGTTAYFGPPSGAETHFQSIGFEQPVEGNPADFFLDVLNGQIRRQGHPEFRPSDLPLLWTQAAKSKPAQPLPFLPTEKTVTQPPNPIPTASNVFQPKNISIFGTFDESKRRTPSFFVVLWLCFVRMVRQYLHNVRGITLHCFLEMVAGFIIGISFLDSRFIPPLPSYYGVACPGVVANAFCFSPQRLDFIRLVIFLALSAGLTVGTVGVSNFGNEKPVYWREASAGVSPSAYFLGKCLAEIPPVALYALSFSSAFYVVTSHEIPFGDFYLLLFLFMLASVAMGYCASVLLDQQGLLLASVIGMISCLGSGGVNTVREMGFLGNLAWSRFFGEALLIKAVSLDSFSPAQQEAILKFNEAGLELDFDNFSMCILGLVLHSIALRCLAFVILRIRHREKQK